MARSGSPPSTFCRTTSCWLHFIERDGDTAYPCCGANPWITGQFMALYTIPASTSGQERRAIWLIAASRNGRLMVLAAPAPAQPIAHKPDGAQQYLLVEPGKHHWRAAAGLLLEMDEPRLLGQAGGQGSPGKRRHALVRHDVRYGYTGFPAGYNAGPPDPQGTRMKYKDLRGISSRSWNKRPARRISREIDPYRR